MKFDTINGEEIITLAKNESIVLKFEKEPQTMTITNKPTNIELRASGMIKEEVPATYTEVYERWLAAYSVILDKFYEMTKKSACTGRGFEILLRLCNYTTGSIRTISLDMLTFDGKLIQQGAEMKFKRSEEDDFLYVAAAAVNKFYETVAAEKNDLNGCLTSSKNERYYSFGNAALLIATTCPHTEKMIMQLTECHNHGLSSELVIEDQKSRAIRANHAISSNNEMIKQLMDAERRSAYFSEHDKTEQPKQM